MTGKAMNTLAADPVRMSGHFGSQILRANVARAYQPDPCKGEARPLDETVDDHLEDRVKFSHLAHGRRNRLQEFQIHGIRVPDSTQRNNDS